MNSKQDQEAALYYKYLAFCNLYNWKASEQGFEGFKRTEPLREKWAKRRKGEKQ